jgi:rod shape-determining protein MreC
MIGYRRANRRYILLVLVLTAITLITLDSRRDDAGALGTVGRAAHALVSPIEGAVNAVASPVSDWFSGVTDGSSLKSDNRDLRARVGELENQQRMAKAALAQNDQLRKLLGLPILSDIPRVTARIINRSPGNFESTVTINKGEEVGISKDMVVLGPDGLVGRVLESYHGGAKVLLLVDPHSGVGVRVLPGLVSGVAQGVGGSDELRVDLEVNNPPIKVGDVVVTSGEEQSDFPEGLMVGNITKIEPEQAGLGTIVRVKPFTDFNALEYVTVLKWIPGQGPVTTTTTTTTTITVAPTTAPGSSPTTAGSGNGP